MLYADNCDRKHRDHDPMMKWLYPPALILVIAFSGILDARMQEQTTVVVTFSILEDFAERLVDEDVEVISLVPRGAEVHEYELRPKDFKALERADVVFYNGLALEQWMPQVRAVVGDGIPVVSVAERSGIETLPIVSGEYEGQVDPHAWMDPRRAGQYVSAMASELTAILPQSADDILARAESYRIELQSLYEEMAKTLASIPPLRRVLISSEAAFVYFADSFDFFHEGIWGNNAESEGGPRQLMRVIDIIAERQPTALFWESTVSSRSVKTISADTQVPYYGPLYVDSLAAGGSEPDSYIDMMRSNVAVLEEALRGDD